MVCILITTQTLNNFKKILSFFLNMRIGLVVILLLETDLNSKLGQRIQVRLKTRSLPVERRREPFPRCSDLTLQPHLLVLAAQKKHC